MPARAPLQPLALPTGDSIADMAIHPWAHYLERHGFEPARQPRRAAARMDEAFTALATETRKAATPADLDRFFGRTDRVPPADYSSITR